MPVQERMNMVNSAKLVAAGEPQITLIRLEGHTDNNVRMLAQDANGAQLADILLAQPALALALADEKMLFHAAVISSIPKVPNTDKMLISYDTAQAQLLMER